MADKRISQLDELTTPGSSDVLAIVNSGTTKKIQNSNYILNVRNSNTALTAAGSELQVGYNLANGSITSLGASIVDAVFGNGSYCESQMGADERAFSYRLVGTATYNNFNNSAWSLTPSFVWSHDPSGYGPSSLGGFNEGRQSLSLSLTARKGDAITTSLSYVDQLGDPTDNSRGDMDYISANVSYAF